MTNDIQWEIVFGQFLNRAKTECKTIFSDSFNPHWKTGEVGELVSLLENNINTMHPDANRFKEVCRNLRKEYQDFTTKSGLSKSDNDS